MPHVVNNSLYEFDFRFSDVEVSRLEDIESLSHVNLQNNPISDDLKSQLQSCNFTVLLGNSSVS